MQDRALGGRHFGLDWLRIGAFALLILYHIGMFFVPWDFHVKTARPIQWLELPMLAVNPWRLSLLFLIAGIASRKLLEKAGSAGRFASLRSTRLLVPLLATVAIFVVPQPWAELREKTGYSQGFWHFWIWDYFEFGASRGVIVPTWNHLWFVAYLWLYTMVLALVSLAPESLKALLQRSFDRAIRGWRLFLLPALLFWAARMTLYPAFGETHALLDDPYAHVVYGLAYFLGVGFAGCGEIWTALRTHWKTAAWMALAGYLVIVGFEMRGTKEASELELVLPRLGRSIQAWGAILALMGLAHAHLNRDGPARRYLTEAIFPYYIAHQTIIVLVGHGLRPRALGAGAEFLLIFAATLAGCAVAYEAGKRIPWLRPLLGLPPQRRAQVRNEAATAISSVR